MDRARAKTEPAQVPLEAHSDHALLERYRHGSEDAATQLYLRYAARLRGLARAQLTPALLARVDVDDIVQSVFGSFFRRARQGYYDVPAGEELWRLFLVMALHKIRGQAAFHRAAKRDVGRSVSDGELSEQRDDGAALAFLQMVIDEALAQLAPLQREMVELRVAGHTVDEIAQQTGRARRSVERLLQEARRKLGELLGAES